jgi:hypothetical protein
VRKHSRVLLVGQVQGGKTRTYLNVAKCLLGGNDGFTPEIVIILAGIHGDLRVQTEVRATTEAKDAGLPAESFYVFLKNRKRLEDALVVAQKAREAGRPVLIIDDESDQASPNTRARRNLLEGAQDRSAVNAALVKLVEEVLRPDEKGDSVGRYLACTATPVATLLTPRSDILSCDAAVLLEAHDEYFGPADALQHVKLLPEPADGSDNFLLWSNLFVLYYFVGGALEALESSDPYNSSPGLRQLMVHVSQQIEPQNEVLKHLKKEIEGWLGFLADPTAAPQYYQDRLDEALKFFERNLDPETQLVFRDRAGTLLRRLQTDIVVVNNKAKHEDDVFSSKAGIVGGNMLSRGITLPALITSGIVRALRDSTPLDTVLQWMRFCGPRKQYAQYVTILLTPDVHAAFELIVEADKDLRDQLRNSADDGVVYLPPWRRSFLLPLKQATRSSVVGMGVEQRQFGSGWNQFRKFDTDAERCQHNLEVLDQLVASFNLEQGCTNGVHLFEQEQIEVLFSLLEKFKRPGAAENEAYFDDIPDLLRDKTNFRLHLPGNTSAQERSADWVTTLSTTQATTLGAVNNVFSNQVRESNLRDSSATTIHFRRIRPKLDNGTLDVLGAIYLPDNIAEKAFKRTIELGNPRQNSVNHDGVYV